MSSAFTNLAQVLLAALSNAYPVLNPLVSSLNANGSAIFCACGDISFKSVLPSLIYFLISAPSVSSMPSMPNILPTSIGPSY